MQHRERLTLSSEANVSPRRGKIDHLARPCLSLGMEPLPSSFPFFDDTAVVQLISEESCHLFERPRGKVGRTGSKSARYRNFYLGLKKCHYPVMARQQLGRCTRLVNDAAVTFLRSRGERYLAVSICLMSPERRYRCIRGATQSDFL